MVVVVAHLGQPVGSSCRRYTFSQRQARYLRQAFASHRNARSRRAAVVAWPRPSVTCKSAPAQLQSETELFLEQLEQESAEVSITASDLRAQLVQLESQVYDLKSFSLHTLHETLPLISGGVSRSCKSCKHTLMTYTKGHSHTTLPAMVTQNPKLHLAQSLALQRRLLADLGAPSLRSEADHAILFFGLGVVALLPCLICLMSLLCVIQKAIMMHAVTAQMLCFPNSTDASKCIYEAELGESFSIQLIVKNRRSLS